MQKTHGIVSLAKILPGWEPPRVEQPKRIVSPKHVAPKVIGDPTREPVNKQAAMLITRAHYLELPPLPPSEPPKGLIEKLQEENSKLKAVNASLISENNALRKKFQEKKHLPKTLPEVSTEASKVSASPFSKAEKRLKIMERLSAI